VLYASRRRFSSLKPIFDSLKSYAIDNQVLTKAPNGLGTTFSASRFLSAGGQNQPGVGESKPAILR
jgi:hypothetical protein